MSRVPLAKILESSLSVDIGIFVETTHWLWLNTNCRPTLPKRAVSMASELSIRFKPRWCLFSIRSELFVSYHDLVSAFNPKKAECQGIHGPQTSVVVVLVHLWEHRGKCCWAKIVRDLELKRKVLTANEFLSHGRQENQMVFHFKANHFQAGVENL